jgi:hypothetical protein
MAGLNTISFRVDLRPRKDAPDFSQSQNVLSDVERMRSTLRRRELFPARHGANALWYSS